MTYYVSSGTLTPTHTHPGSPATISVKFCTEVKGWLRYKMAYRNIAENINRLSMAQERYRRQTDRQTDLRHQRPERNVVTFG